MLGIFRTSGFKYYPMRVFKDAVLWCRESGAPKAPIDVRKLPREAKEQDIVRAFVSEGNKWLF